MKWLSVSMEDQLLAKNLTDILFQFLVSPKPFSFLSEVFEPLVHLALGDEDCVTNQAEFNRRSYIERLQPPLWVFAFIGLSLMVIPPQIVQATLGNLTHSGN